ncbi:prostaglandin reductase 1 isoform X1 [Penaeus vannamei]|uniref:prostaglandin reductase 1 isoform X1 n=1 Tax=Penaeus vannamei TaxID=6689 RepID=UPI00387F907B
MSGTLGRQDRIRMTLHSLGLYMCCITLQETLDSETAYRTQVGSRRYIAQSQRRAKATPSMVLSKVWKLSRRPVGLPSIRDFTLVEEQVPPCQAGDVIVQAECLSVDPYMRNKAKILPLGSTMDGGQVARVIESKNAEWPVGSFMVTQAGWRCTTHLSLEKLQTTDFWQKSLQLPDMRGLPMSLGLGTLGMPGNSALFGLTEILRPVAGETVLVSGAAGAVGSVVVQIAKIKGCKVIGFAGADDKVDWLREIGADHAFNYKKVKVGEALRQAAPEKINCYFDNVGGSFTASVMPHMAFGGRVAVCGAISGYNKQEEEEEGAMTGCFKDSDVLWNCLRIRGFMFFEFADRWMEGLEQLRDWVLEGKIKYKEHVVNGFEKMPDTFIGVLKGEYRGKAIITP